MYLQEKLLYHQIHPAKLAADIGGSIASSYFIWQHQFWTAMVAAFVPALLGSALVIRFADLERMKASRLGRYISWSMTRPIEVWRFGGQIVMWVGAWYHQWATILLGAVLVLAAWMCGLVRKGRSEGRSH